MSNEIIHLFESESNEDFDFSDSGSEYMVETSSQPVDDSESDSDIDVTLMDNIGNVQNTPTQSYTEVSEMDVRWLEKETDMPDFNFTKQNELLVPIPGNGNPLDFFSYYSMTISLTYWSMKLIVTLKKSFYVLVVFRVHVYRCRNPRIKMKF